MMDQGQEISICIKICSPGQEKRQVLKKMMFGKKPGGDMPIDKKPKVEKEETEEKEEDLEGIPY